MSDIAAQTAVILSKIGGGNYDPPRYIDIIEPKPQDNRTGAEIAADVIKKAGLKIVKPKQGGEKGGHI